MIGNNKLVGNSTEIIDEQRGYKMRNIDIHSHLLPQCMWEVLDSGQEWYGEKDVTEGFTPKLG